MLALLAWTGRPRQSSRIRSMPRQHCYRANLGEPVLAGNAVAIDIDIFRDLGILVQEVLRILVRIEHGAERILFDRRRRGRRWVIHRREVFAALLGWIHGDGAVAREPHAIGVGDRILLRLIERVLPAQIWTVVLG